MAETANLGLSLLAAEQAQKHITMNEALIGLDAIVQLAVKDGDLTAPPGSPVAGDRYIVDATATGAWAGHESEIAAWDGSAWLFHAPQEGWRAWLDDENTLLVFDGSAWIDIGAAIDVLQNLSLLGIGTNADATNPFSAKLNKALWTARTAAEGGDGDLRYTMNKESAGDVLSLLLQTGFSGRAEIGLVGDDDLTFKVSPDGSAWVAALVVDKDDGSVTLVAPLAIVESANHGFRLRARPDVALTYPVPFLKPTGSNKTLAFDLMPNGSPSETARGYAWLDICDADLEANPAAAVRCAGAAITSLSAQFGSWEYNGGASTPVEMMVDGAAVLTLSASLVQSAQRVKVPDGSFAAPALAIGSAATEIGFWRSGAGLFLSPTSGGMAFTMQANSTANFVAQRSDGSTTGGALLTYKSRGSVSAPSVVQQNDLVGGFFMRGYNGSAFLGGVDIQGQVIAATPSASDMQARMTLNVTPAGAVSTSEIARLEHATGLSMFGANPVIDQNRHLRLRSYTVATLPSASPAGQLIYASDGTANKRLAVSDGTNWRFPDGNIVS